MNDSTQADRQAIREYLLDTLSPEARDAVEARILESRAWQQALEAEREALGLLDALPDAETPGDLAARTITRVEDAAEAESRTRPLFGSWVSVVATLAIVGILGAILLPALARSREAARRASTQNNMKQIGLMLKMYANESPGEKYPPRTPYKDFWMFDIELLYPEFLTDWTILVDLERRDAEAISEELGELFQAEEPDWERITELASLSFKYTGWVVKSEDEADRLSRAYAQLSPEQLDEDLGSNEETIHRLREGIERFLITDINNAAASAAGQSEIPILVSNADGESEAGNVLYLDGHVETWIPGAIESNLRWFLDVITGRAPPD